MINHRTIVTNTVNEKSTIQWMVDNNYIYGSKLCEECEIEMPIKEKRGKTIFRCKRCRNEKSIFSGSIFYNTKMTIVKCMDIIYFWCLDLLQIEI
jgi:hypothetical protein